MATALAREPYASSRPASAPRGGRRGLAWFTLLLAAVCFEGLGRKLAPAVPGVAFYVAKDAILLLGLVAFGVRPPVSHEARRLMRVFLPVLPLAVAWTIVQAFNPGQGHAEFALLGLRSYWLWWLAPLVVASALQRENDRENAMLVLGGVAIIVAGFAMVQFSLPPSHPLNRYAPTVIEMGIADVQTTGRARVTSTFSYITGFTDFVTIVPAILLSLGLTTASRARRTFLLGATVISAVAIPMSGSRAPVLLALGGLALVAWAAGLLWTRQGRRVIVAGALSIAVAILMAPDAIQGVGDRFFANPSETRGRLGEALGYVPPFAMAFTDYPLLGLGTGTLQNAAVMYGATQEWVVEHEHGRVLVEQGIPGYLLISLLRIGLVVGLFRAGRILKRAGMRTEAGAAWALAAFTLPGNLFFDHVFQALYFIGVGIVLEGVVRARARS